MMPNSFPVQAVDFATTGRERVVFWDLMVISGMRLVAIVRETVFPPLE